MSPGNLDSCHLLSLMAKSQEVSEAVFSYWRLTSSFQRQMQGHHCWPQSMTTASQALKKGSRGSTGLQLMICPFTEVLGNSFHGS